MRELKDLNEDERELLFSVASDNHCYHEQCEKCGSVEHMNNLRTDDEGASLCPRCYRNFQEGL